MNEGDECLILFKELTDFKQGLNARLDDLGEWRRAELKKARRQLEMVSELEIQERARAAEHLRREITNLETRRDELVQTKSELEKELSALRAAVTRLENASPTNDLAESLAILQSIAPVRLTELSAHGRLAGVVAMGTPETTRMFEFENRRGSEESGKIWRLLEQMSESLSEKSRVESV
jgi:chromosome segregation ATPase